MSDTHTRNAIRIGRMARAKFTAATALVLAGAAISVNAQQVVAPSFTQEKLLSSISGSSSAAISSSLPDAPSAVLAPAESASSSGSAVPAFGSGSQTRAGQIVPPGQQMAPVHSLNIQPGQQAASLTSRDKFVISVEETYSFDSLAGYVLAGAYSDITNGEPNYGTNPRALGQRVGAAALRGASEDLLADGLLASAFHEDPRYYIDGDNYNFFHRLVDAGTRPLITRSDSGHKRVNASLLVGYLAASALTVTYYPQQNRNATDVARTYGSSIGGAAVGFVFEEFIGDVVGVFHHRQQP